MKRIISLLLAVVLVLNYVPAASAATPMSSDEYIEVTSATAPLREGPGKTYDEIVTLEQGDCLMVTGFTENKHGHIWFEVEYAGVRCYIYSEHAEEFHKHNYNVVSDGLSVCKCGMYTIDSTSPILQTGVATAGTLLGAEAVAAAGQLSAAGGTIATGFTAAFPYVAVVVVGGLLIYMAVSKSGTQVRNITKVESIADVQDLVGSSNNGNTYFAAAFSFGKHPALLIASKGMDLNEATDYLGKIASNPFRATIAGLSGKSMFNIWTFSENLAKKLCVNFTSLNQQYSYADSKKNYGAYEHDHTYKDYKIYFEHYHIFRKTGAFSMTKDRKIHILFGNPLPKAVIV